jgi:hypothetical protein
MKPLECVTIHISMTNQVGANDSLLEVRVVPAGRNGSIVLGRSLRAGEQDTGATIQFNPYAGEELHFPVGSIHTFITDVDKKSPRGPDGYAPVSNTLWTWLTVYSEAQHQTLFRYLFAAARRLDAAHGLCADVLADLTALNEVQEGFIQQRARLFRGLGNAELMCVAFGRTIDMLREVEATFGIQVQLAAAAITLAPAMLAIRNAFEHIEDRALGNVRGSPHPDALSIFNQQDFVPHGVLRYANHSLDLRADVVPLLVASRATLIDIAQAVIGAGRTYAQAITFPKASPEAFERVKERAYFLWESRTGAAWNDADANWYEAERLEREASSAANTSP